MVRGRLQGSIGVSGRPRTRRTAAADPCSCCGGVPLDDRVRPLCIALLSHVLWEVMCSRAFDS